MGTDPIFQHAENGEPGDFSLQRDPIGERSIYYAQLGDRIVHAATLRELLDSNPLAWELSLPAVATYLAWGYLPGRETLLRGVYKVLPGEPERPVETVRRAGDPGCSLRDPTRWP